MLTASTLLVLCSYYRTQRISLRRDAGETSNSGDRVCSWASAGSGECAAREARCAMMAGC